KRAKPRGDRIGLRQRRLKRLDIVGAAGSFLLQLQIGGDRFDVAVAEIHRIEIETQPQQEGTGADDDERGHDEDRRAMALEKVINRSEEPVAERTGLAARLELAQQRRQQRYAGQKGDQHAETGDQAEFGQSLISRRQERQETCGGGQRRKRQRRAGAPPRMQQRLMQPVDFMPLGPVTDAELNAEIDSKADEQYREVDGNQIERPDQHQAQRRRYRQ